MTKTIFGKLMSIIFLVIIISMIITSVLLFGLLGDYVVRERKDTLLDEAARVNELTAFYLKNNNLLVERIYFMNIKDVSRRIGGIIFITDEGGNILITSDNTGNHMNVTKIEPNLVGGIIRGNTLVQLGNFGGVFANTYLTVGSPLSVQSSNVGAIFLAVPAPEINRIKYDLFSIFIISVAIAVAAAIALSYVLSKRLSRPLKEMSIAARKIAQGDFNTRVRVRGNDEIAQLGETFNNMANSLLGLENMRSSFIANVSHELRTPMTTISGFIEGILDKTIPEEKSREYLSIVLDEIKRLARLVNELLVLARIEAGEVRLELSDFDINELVRVTILRFEKQLTEKNIEVEISFDMDPCWVKADRDSIARVLTNLFDNALKFNIPNGYIKVMVEESGERVRVSVENSGIGISREELPLVWERFYKTDKSRSYDKKGVGLGLFIVHSIISSHNEKIWVNSEEGKYTRFTFTLKKCRAPYTGEKSIKSD